MAGRVFPLDKWKVARLRLTLNLKYIITIDRHKEDVDSTYIQRGGHH